MIEYTHMPSKKILIVLIICIAVILSVFIYQKNTKNYTEENTGLTTINNKNIEVNYDWKKILNESSSTSISWINNNGVIEETTLTDQVAKDFFSQFLLLKKNNGEVTESDAINIAKNTLSSSDFNNIHGTVYIESNLHITDVNSKTVKNYYDNMLEISNILKSHKIIEEVLMIKKAIEKEDGKTLTKLDPTIANYKKIILKLQEIQVPSDAKTIHLDFLNNVSNVLFSLESMRNFFSDPVKGALSMDRYQLYITNMTNSTQKIQIYFDLKK